MKSLVVIGGGFAGLEFARRFFSSQEEVTLIDQTNHHLFQPLLYQVAGAQLAPSDIATPLRELLKAQENVRVLLEEVVSIDPEERKIFTKTHATIPYDTLVLALGNRPKKPLDPLWRPYVSTLKTMEDALKIRTEILLSYEEGEWLGRAPHFVIVGGGPTGVELAGILCEMAKKTLNHNFRSLKNEETRITLIEYSDRILNSFSQEASRYAAKILKKMGVEILYSERIQNISKGSLELSHSTLQADLIVWAAGTEGTSLAQKLSLPKDKEGRFLVDENLAVLGYPSIYAIGDCAKSEQKGGKILPGLAPVAKQQGHYLAKMLSQGERKKPFHYLDKGNLATIGKRKAVGEAFGISFKGLLAWSIWAVVHIYFLVQFSSKILVVSRWIWSYLTGNKTSRLIENSRRPKEEGSSS